jgi:hypothetical protein
MLKDFEDVEMVEPEPLLARCLTRLLSNRTSETSNVRRRMRLAKRLWKRGGSHLSKQESTVPFDGLNEMCSKIVEDSREMISPRPLLARCLTRLLSSRTSETCACQAT